MAYTRGDRNPLRASRQNSVIREGGFYFWRSHRAAAQARAEPPSTSSRPLTGKNTARRDKGSTDYQCLAHQNPGFLFADVLFAQATAVTSGIVVHS